MNRTLGATATRILRRRIAGILSEGVVVLAVAGHFGFLVYLVVGGFLAARWPRTCALHLAVVSWGVGSVVFGFACPLTALERWGRAGAGMAPLPPEGFIAHYLTGVLYPADAAGLIQMLVFVVIVLSWVTVWRSRVREAR